MAAAHRVVLSGSEPAAHHTPASSLPSHRACLRPHRCPSFSPARGRAGVCSRRMRSRSTRSAARPSRPPTAEPGASFTRRLAALTARAAGGSLGSGTRRAREGGAWDGVSREARARTARHDLSPRRRSGPVWQVELDRRLSSLRSAAGVRRSRPAARRGWLRRRPPSAARSSGLPSPRPPARAAVWQPRPPGS
jgi:hypothetical protein